MLRSRSVVVFSNVQVLPASTLFVSAATAFAAIDKISEQAKNAAAGFDRFVVIVVPWKKMRMAI
jgi:hypothetical protein